MKLIVSTVLADKQADPATELSVAFISKIDAGIHSFIICQINKTSQPIQDDFNNLKAWVSLRIGLLSMEGIIHLCLLCLWFKMEFVNCDLTVIKAGCSAEPTNKSVVAQPARACHLKIKRGPSKAKPLSRAHASTVEEIHDRKQDDGSEQSDQHGGNGESTVDRTDVKDGAKEVTCQECAHDRHNDVDQQVRTVIHKLSCHPTDHCCYY